ncbi:MAG: cytochrome P450 [Acidimicrobiales bacterium]|nr:cytochrome P450 [Acidimicrobiales bacterium]
MTTATDHTRFDPFEDGFASWPYDQYARLRRDDPVHHSDLLQGWMLTRYDDVDRVLKDATISSVIDNATPTTHTRIEIERRTEIGYESNPLPLLDEPDHTRIRRLIAPTFRKGSIRHLRETIERHVDSLLDAVVERHGSSGTFDLVADIAYPMPVAVICELMGIPDEDGHEFRRWVQLVALGLDPMIDADQREASLAAGEEMRDYLRAQVAAKRADPTDDLTSALVHHTENGDRLEDGELIAQLQTLYMAGHEPVTAVLANGMIGLLDQPDELARLRDEPDLVANAVLELLRWDGPNQFVRRIAMADLDFDGGTVPAGAVVYPCIGSADHDPTVFGDDADHIRLDRASSPYHLQFGAGIHSCLGSHLAKLEIEIALDRLVQRFDSLSPAAEPSWSQRMVLRSANEVPLAYTAGP